MSARDIHEVASQWLKNDPDPTTVEELRALLEANTDEAEAQLAERFAGPLTFGTAGLRGIVGAGETRMNRAVILKTSAGLASYVKETVEAAKSRGIVVGFDGRLSSEGFANDAAAAFTGAGIRTYLFPTLVPTPLVAFAVARLGAAAGVMVTASHNPPEYNGYKVYWSGGAQIIPPHDRGIAEAIAAVGSAREVPTLDPGPATAKQLLVHIDSDIHDDYVKAVLELSKNKRGRDLLKIVYSAMHGVGDPWTREVLERYGFESVWSVPEQREPDGTFPTVRFPNPEEAGALDLSMKLGREKGANLILVNDPDADRLAVAIPSEEGYRQLSGNEVGLLLGDYILRSRPSSARKPLVVTTVVSSPGLAAIARAYGARFIETLTGFKWIATEAMALAEAESLDFLFGFEEALGYTIGTAVRDKDGVSAAAVFAELAATVAADGRSIDDELERLARRDGLYLSRQRSITKKGLEGAAAIRAALDGLRRQPVTELCGAKVIVHRDFWAGVEVRDGLSRSLDMPKSNVLSFELEDGARIVARPSGTEPKIKFYFDVREPMSGSDTLSAARERANRRLDSLVAEFLERVSID